ncbi:hypothetical protein V6N13_052488 [Hibiscus sabdariffa]|uniref:Uncharacterized protein n=1 Tax=Hibiscus sabdariffa TaxID=183260 RepID=A0ABR2Q525_9ROSI
METPSSTRRVTRSQALSSLNNSNITFSKGNKEEESDKSVSKNGKQQNERAALIDITNDSPIVGLAMETPSSAVGKQRCSRAKIMVMTPGSGEALLRGQVKTLLQKVEEEAELSKVESRPFLGVEGCVGILAPTPVNTPQLSNVCGDGLGSIVIALPVVEQEWRLQEASLESQKSVITRSLLFDFSEDSSESYSEDQGKSSAPTDGGDIEELCDGLSKIRMEEMLYNSDDEMEREEEGEAMRLKGLPTPKGKHLRFPIEEEDDDA